jgi:hypothetical protein
MAMVNLSTLEGISDARNDLYVKLEAGLIDEKKASQMERILRGQTELKATVPIRLLNTIIKAKGATSEQYGPQLLDVLMRFTTGNGLALQVPKN